MEYHNRNPSGFLNGVSNQGMDFKYRWIMFDGDIMGCELDMKRTKRKAKV